MTNDNQDALRCAECLNVAGHYDSERHILRLVADNEAKDALLRQAVEALDVISGDVCLHVHHAKKDQHDYDDVCPVHVRHCEAISAIRQHLDQKTT